MMSNPRKPFARGKGFFGWLTTSIETEELPIRQTELHDTSGAVYDPASGWRNVHHRPAKKRT